jgi:hypothetical protein
MLDPSAAVGGGVAVVVSPPESSSPLRLTHATAATSTNNTQATRVKIRMRPG